VTVASFPLPTDSRHPSSESERGECDHVCKDLDPSVDPYETFEGGQADQEDP